MRAKINKYLMPLFLVMLLVGCETPTVFGVPKEQWNILTNEQKNEAIRGYNQHQQQAEANAPAMAAVGAINAYANQTAQERRVKQQREDYKKMGFPEWMVPSY